MVAANQRFFSVRQHISLCLYAKRKVQMGYSDIVRQYYLRHSDTYSLNARTSGPRCAPESDTNTNARACSSHCHCKSGSNPNSVNGSRSAGRGRASNAGRHDHSRNTHAKASPPAASVWSRAGVYPPCGTGRHGNMVPPQSPATWPGSAQNRLNH